MAHDQQRRDGLSPVLGRVLRRAFTIGGIVVAGWLIGGGTQAHADQADAPPRVGAPASVSAVATETARQITEGVGCVLRRCVNALPDSPVRATPRRTAVNESATGRADHETGGAAPIREHDKVRLSPAERAPNAVVAFLARRLVDPVVQFLRPAMRVGALVADAFVAHVKRLPDFLGRLDDVPSTLIEVMAVPAVISRKPQQESSPGGAGVFPGRDAPSDGVTPASAVPSVNESPGHPQSPDGSGDTKPESGLGYGDVARPMHPVRTRVVHAPVAMHLPPAVRTAADEPTFSPD